MALVCLALCSIPRPRLEVLSSLCFGEETTNRLGQSRLHLSPVETPGSDNLQNHVPVDHSLRRVPATSLLREIFEMPANFPRFRGEIASERFQTSYPESRLQRDMALRLR
jgi:hypothetical protein